MEESFLSMYELYELTCMENEGMDGRVMTVLSAQLALDSMDLIMMVGPFWRNSRKVSVPSNH